MSSEITCALSTYLVQKAITVANDVHHEIQFQQGLKMLRHTLPKMQQEALDLNRASNGKTSGK
jgi:hypothetical protein